MVVEISRLRFVTLICFAGGSALVLAFWLYAWHAEIPSSRMAGSAMEIAQGEVLARVGNCIARPVLADAGLLDNAP